MDFGFMMETLFALLSGVPLTVNLTLTAVAAGAVLATAVAGLQFSRIPLLPSAARFYVFVIRGTPLLIQIFLIYYGLGQFRPTLQAWGVWPVFREPYWCAVLALTLNTAAYGSEIIRGGLRSVPFGQTEAARACGMSGLLLARRIVFPIALRYALPAYGNEVILMIKATSLTSIITMMEVTGIAAKLISETFRTMEVFVVAASIYLALTFCITGILTVVERAISPHLRGSVVGKLSKATHV
jgi:octopine/nopaline transport system permease protein